MLYVYFRLGLLPSTAEKNEVQSVLEYRLQKAVLFCGYILMHIYAYIHLQVI